ncbi:16729_t:CDS:1, partial [Acaulospora colombiana]
LLRQFHSSEISTLAIDSDRLSEINSGSSWSSSVRLVLSGQWSEAGPSPTPRTRSGNESSEYYTLECTSHVFFNDYLVYIFHPDSFTRARQGECEMAKQGQLWHNNLTSLALKQWRTNLGKTYENYEYQSENKFISPGWSGPNDFIAAERVTRRAAWSISSQ